MVLKLLTRPLRLHILSFVDESLMICKIDIYKIKELNNILKMYQQASEKHINMDKFEIIFSKKLFHDT